MTEKDKEKKPVRPSEAPDDWKPGDTPVKIDDSPEVDYGKKPAKEDG